MDINILRNTYPEFHYDAYQHYHDNDDIVIQFSFSCGQHSFMPTLRIKDIPQDSLYRTNQKAFDVFVFQIGMVEMLSYWKAFLSAQIVIHPHHLTDIQKSFFDGLLLKGMGEFFYKNQIDAREDSFVTIQSLSAIELSLFNTSLAHRYLIPVGGGKDSAVTLGLLQQQNSEFGIMVVNPTKAALDVSAATGKPVITIQRTIDPLLLQLHKEGHPNGHTPFSAYLAFVSMFVAGVFDYDTVLLSNERSAEEATVRYLDQDVNHQYSKTFAFETILHQYITTYLSSNISYISLLRPLYELQIAKKFSEYPMFHSLIRSCNQGSKENKWCGVCPKCVSTYILLFHFLGEKTVAIFGKDMYADERLIARVKELIDMNVVRPFECVGTREESMIGLFMAVEFYQQQGKALPALLKQIQVMYLDKEERLAERKQDLLASFGNDHLLSEELKKIVNPTMLKTSLRTE